MPPSSSTPEPIGLFDEVLARGGVREATGDRAWLQAMLDAEAGLAWALADAEVIEASAAEAINAACRAERFVVADLATRAAASGNPVVPLVRALTDAVAAPAAGHVHRGATSQDIIDTAMMLIARDALDVLIEDLAGAADEAARLARTHRDLAMPARTLLQQAVPTTFGCRAAGWMTGLDTVATRLRSVRASGLPVQLGGAAGTLASLGDAGPRVVAAFARRVGLIEPVLPWHTVRTPVGELAGTLGVTAGVCGKIARDVTLLAQTEVGEVSEGVQGRGGSSTMPHKHNPVAAIATVAAATTAPGLVSTLLTAMTAELERAAGAWHAEWMAWTDLLRVTGSAAAWLRDCLTNLDVHADRMRANLALTGGAVLAQRVVTALTDEMGRLEAHDLVRRASNRAAARSTDLFTELSAMPQVSEVCGRDELRRLLDPDDAVGTAAALVDRALARRA
ncbi:MAG TPA: 3-carboxy-cis,cis-muconate cycloisomerase [Euzebyales bacterium]